MADESSVGRTLSSYFRPTPEELARIASTPPLAADAAGWREFASAVQRQVIEAYELGEISLERAWETRTPTIMSSVSGGCSEGRSRCMSPLSACAGGERLCKSSE